MNHRAISGLLKDSLRGHGSVLMKLEGKSMLPFLKSGTLMTVRNSGIKDIRVGDIVIFKKEEMTIAHRVIKRVEVDGRFFLRAKSDISFSPEPLISQGELIGKVVAFRRFGRDIKIDNFIFRLLGLSAGTLFPFIARIRFLFRSVADHAVQSQI